MNDVPFGDVWVKDIGDVSVKVAGDVSEILVKEVKVNEGEVDVDDDVEDDVDLVEVDTKLDGEGVLYSSVAVDVRIPVRIYIEKYTENKQKSPEDHTNKSEPCVQQFASHSHQQNR